MRLGRDIIWFAKAAVTAAVILLLCALTSRYGQIAAFPTTLVAGSNVEEPLERYARNPQADIALVGSSYSVRLDEAFFAHPKLRNLAIAGGSNLTGLEILASYPQLPRVILVEANVLSRGANPAQVQKYSSRSYVARPPMIRPIRRIAAAYQLWRGRPHNASEERARLAELLNVPPADYANAEYAARQMEADDKDVSAEEFKRHAALLLAAVQALRDRGARVYFYTLPHQGELNHTKYAEITREVMHQTFPDQESWLDLDYPAAQLRFADSMHLDERSALLVVQSMDRAIDRLKAARP